MPQHALLSPDLIDYDFIGRFENLSADLQRLGRVLGIETFEAYTPHVTGANTQIEKFYGCEEVNLVRRIYKEDFETFLYSKDLRLV